jgi:hypothetical protein
MIMENDVCKNTPIASYCDKVIDMGLKGKLLDNATIVDDYIMNIYNFLTEYNERYNTTISENEILDLCTNSEI